jgi:peptidoglycan/xylan/chitin deacetylase (PgdA/CDA1 family)
VNYKENKKIILSFDIEFWFDEGFLTKYLKTSESISDESTGDSVLPILDLMQRHKAKATFFITGKFLEKYPQLVKKISDMGNEIGYHGYEHKSLHNLSPEKFEEELDKGIKLVENITGKRLVSFRAPCFSLDNNTKWALPILAKAGFKYDSSIFPLKTPHYGVNGTPIFPIVFHLKTFRRKMKILPLLKFQLLCIIF